MYRADLELLCRCKWSCGIECHLCRTCMLGMHALSGCDTTSYPHGKGKISALNTLLAQEFSGLADVLGEVDTMHKHRSGRGNKVSALYSQLPGTSMGSVSLLHQTLHQEDEENPKVMALPPTSANLLQHTLRAHLHRKAADHQGPPNESADITHFGWEIRDDIPIPVIAQGDPAPPELIDVIQCQCRAQGKKCSTEACGCHKQHLSCTSFCNCSSDASCCTHHTRRCSGWR